MEPVDTPFLSLAEVGELLRLSRTRVYQLVRDGEIPATTLGGVLRVPRGSFDAWLADHERRALDSCEGDLELLEGSSER